MRVTLSLVMVLGACGSKDGGEPATKATPAGPPITVSFGDCAAPTVAFVSGPRPLPFTGANATGTWVAQDDPLPPPPPEDESGGTGTAMALDEGKMGKKDAARVEGQYRMKKPDSPAGDRQRAIEQARAAGILDNPIGATGFDGFDDANIYGGLLGNEGELKGGFGIGVSGIGGTGWGTIGTGGYGTIGTLGSQRKPRGVPTLSLGQPTQQGDLDKAIIRRYIKRNLNKITYCYEKELLAKPGLKGTVDTKFAIGAGGDVIAASATGVDPDVSSCIAGVIKAIEFPKPKGSIVQVNYPFVLRSSDDDATPTGTGSAGSGSAVATSGSAVATGSGSAAAPATTPRSIFRPADQAVDDDRYTPGETSPLRPKQAAIADCLRASPTRSGAVVLDLTYDAAGAVTAATARGIDDAATSRCLVAVAKQVKRVSLAATAERCPLAFGDMPTSSLATVDITATASSLDGKAMDDLAPALAARVATVVAAAAPIAIHGPIVVRASDDAPMAMVSRQWFKILEAGDDLVLATRRGADWKLLRPMSFPIIPVPLGTGGRWAPIKGASHGSAPAEVPVTLSLLATKGDVWIGLSRVDDFQQVSRDRAELAKALAAQKQSAFFSDRTDVEIAGEDDATWGDVVMLIDAAEAAGFKDWRLTVPAGLEARPSL
ncbi:MAG: AgmX/PglI C-terminal domain-containing protein [Proteobacteria bacterium]|nr:AgmX/PglI C-terminal domain-containing protein [Pseudomonadota bacterium]